MELELNSIILILNVVLFGLACLFFPKFIGRFIGWLIFTSAKATGRTEITRPNISKRFVLIIGILNLLLGLIIFVK